MTPSLTTAKELAALSKDGTDVLLPGTAGWGAQALSDVLQILDIEGSRMPSLVRCSYSPVVEAAAVTLKTSEPSM